MSARGDKAYDAFRLRVLCGHSAILRLTPPGKGKGKGNAAWAAMSESTRQAIKAGEQRQRPQLEKLLSEQTARIESLKRNRKG